MKSAIFTTALLLFGTFISAFSEDCYGQWLASFEANQSSYEAGRTYCESPWRASPRRCLLENELAHQGELDAAADEYINCIGN